MSMTALPLQGAIRSALAGDSALAALIEDRVFDKVPVDTAGKITARFPYITIFDMQVLDDGADCIDGEEVFIDIHVWSRGVGTVEAKQIAAAVKRVLDGADLDLGNGAALVDIRFQDARFLRDPDGLTTHSVVTFQALTEAA